MRSPQHVLPVILLLAATLGLAACDSDGGGIDEREVDGVYAITALTFDPEPGALSNVDVRSRIDPATLTLTLASGTDSYVLNFRFAGETEQYLISGRFSTTSRNRVEVDFGERATDRRRLLLPRRVTFTFDEGAGTLTADQALTNVDLAAYDPDQFGGLNAVDGRLVITLQRR